MGHGGAVDSDGVIFQWLAHESKNVAEKPGQLVEKEQAIVPQWNFTGTGDHAAIDESGIGVGLMRRERKQLRMTSPRAASSTTATNWILVVSNVSSGVNEARMEGRRLASIVSARALRANCCH